MKLVSARMSCICGASVSFRNIPSAAARSIKTGWLSAHCGDGHKPCSARTAARHRAKADRATSA